MTENVDDTMSRYQRYAARTADTRATRKMRLLISALGLAGEAGEVVDALKKSLGHRQPLDVAHLREELGDVLWYLSDIATALGLDLGDIAAANIAKLRRRYPEGFTTSTSAPVSLSSLLSQLREGPDEIALWRRYPEDFTTSVATPRLVRLSEAAKARGLSASTLRRQCAAGKIKAMRLTPRGPWMIEEAE